MNTEKCSNHESLPEQLRSNRAGRNRRRKLSLAIVTWKVLLKSALKGIVNWRIERQSSCLETVGELSKTCFQIVLKCRKVARIGRRDILWYVHKLARAVTKWTRACDKRQARLISYIQHTSDYRQYRHVGIYGAALSIGIVPRLRPCLQP